MTTLNLQVGASFDDCYHRANDHTFSKTDPHCLAADSTSGSYDYSSGTRFTGVTIGQGDTIDGASMQFSADFGGASIGTTYIEGEAADDAVTFDDDADFDGRARTDATVSWIPAAWVDGTWYTSSEIKTVIQEIVNRGSWAGASLVTFWRDAAGWGGTDTRLGADGFDTSAALAPKLDIDYTPAVGVGVDEMMAAISGGGGGGGGGSGDIQAHSRKPPEVVAY